MGEATKQLRMSIQDKMDSDGIALLEDITSDKGHVYTTTEALDYNTVVEALDLLKLEEQGTKLFLMVNHTTIKKLRQDPRFIDPNSQVGDNTLLTGTVGSIAGCTVIISNKLTDTRSYILTPQALTAFMKRDINIETQRELLYKRTLIGSDCHYVIAIEDYDKIIVIEHKGETTQGG